MPAFHFLFNDPTLANIFNCLLKLRSLKPRCFGTGNLFVSICESS